MNHKIREISARGDVRTRAGNGEQGYTNQTLLTSSFSRPDDVVVDSCGTIFVSDHGNHCIRKIERNIPIQVKKGMHVCLTSLLPVELIHIIVQYLENPQGTVSTFADEGLFGPMGMSIDKKDNLYVADYWNNCIRKINPSGKVRTRDQTEETISSVWIRHNAHMHMHSPRPRTRTRHARSMHQ